MRNRTKKVTVVAFLLALSLVVWTPGTAPAQVPGFPSDLIRFSGSATIDSSDKAPSTAINWLDEHGTYTFTQDPPPPPPFPTACNGISVPDMVPENPFRNCVIATHSGAFQNLVCGNGTAHAGTEAAPIAITEISNPLFDALGPEAETIYVHYTVLFVGGKGILVADVQEPLGAIPQGEAFGVVNISPIGLTAPDPDQSSGPGWGPCATGFTVAGFAVTYQAAI